MRGDVEKMKKRKILARGILIMLVCSVGLIIAQENVNTKKRVNGYIRRFNNSELAEILERHGIVHRFRDRIVQNKNRRRNTRGGDI